MHRSFSDFYADRDGVRTRYLEMVGLRGRRLRDGARRDRLRPAQRALGRRAVRDRPPLPRRGRRDPRVHPSALLFVQGHIRTNCGFRTQLPRPDFGPAVYAPPLLSPDQLRDRPVARHQPGPRPRLLLDGRDRPAVGHAAVPRRVRHDAGVPRAGDYVRTFYDRLDAALASGAQWNYTPALERRDQGRLERRGLQHPRALRRPAGQLPPPPLSPAPPPAYRCASTTRTARSPAGPDRSNSNGTTTRPAARPSSSSPPRRSRRARSIEVYGAGVSCQHNPPAPDHHLPILDRRDHPPAGHRAGRDDPDRAVPARWQPAVGSRSLLQGS